MLSLGRHPLSTGVPEPWVAEWGEDRYGVFVAFTVGEATQRLRWVPAGTFVMGSPESEAWRYDDEGPQREVTITEGYWLGETPCTQALWVAVMGDNPSRFKSADRPVEQVSWEDCQRFLERLNDKVPELGARLPTEAEWERACRAGTTGATWVGELEIVGERNAPVLDAIAWYAGNSGAGFELAEGEDSSWWPDKQYAHTKAGTRPVGKKKPNPLGLYDMLGNVWEWCEDWKGPYDAAAVVNPRGSAAGSRRVYRGGSWYSSAGYVRAALRAANDPSYRLDDLGFRLARGQGEPGQARRASSERPERGASGRGARGGWEGPAPVAGGGEVASENRSSRQLSAASRRKTIRRPCGAGQAPGWLDVTDLRSRDAAAVAGRRERIDHDDTEHAGAHVPLGAARAAREQHVETVLGEVLVDAI